MHFVIRVGNSRYNLLIRADLSRKNLALRAGSPTYRADNITFLFRCNSICIREVFKNKTKYFRLRLYDEVSKRAYGDLRLT